MKEKDRKALKDKAMTGYKFVDQKSGHMQNSDDMVFEGRSHYLLTTEKWRDEKYEERQKAKKYPLPKVNMRPDRSYEFATDMIATWDLEASRWGEEDGEWQDRAYI